MPTPALSSTPKPKWKDMTPAQKKAARAANNPGSTAGGGNYINQLTDKIPGQVDQIYQGTSDIYTNAGNIGNQAQAYGQNNQWSDQAYAYNQDMLSGDMSRNKWEQDAYNDVSGVRNPLNDAINTLLGKYGGAASGGNTGGGGGSSHGGGGGSYRGPSGGGSSSQGGIRDTIGTSSDWVAQQIRKLADPANFDPANNPTLGPLMARLRAESGENQNAMMQDLAMQSEGSGLFGTGSHDYAMTRAREEGQESLDSQIAQILYGDYNAAQERLMHGIDTGNQRDIASMSDATNRYGIDSSAASSAAGIAAQSADAAEGRTLQGLGMLLGAGNDLLGFKGNMANMRQSGQQAANQNGLGFANLGMQGFNTNLAAQQNQLAALGLKGDTAQGSSNAYLQDQANKNSLRLGLGQIGVARQGNNLQRLDMLNNSQNNLMNMLAQLGNMGGGQNTTTPGTPYTGGPPSWLSGLSAGMGTGLNMYQQGFWNTPGAQPQPQGNLYGTTGPGYIA